MRSTTTRRSALCGAPALLAALGLAACEEVEQVQDSFRDTTPYEAYQASLEDAGLAETALGIDWVAAGRSAIETAAPVTLPFREEGFISPELPAAMAYRLTIPRGKRLTAGVALETTEGTRVFVDLFRVAEDEGDPARPLMSTDSVPGQFVLEPWRAGEFILRLQPELLRGGRYTVTLTLETQLAFPVEGSGMRSVQSIFGVDRDAGRRTHDGVDIFARRGTPVLAASAGTVNRVELTNLGGKVVWVRDPVRNANIYYAHLDSQVVRSGQWVEVGDTLGFVGNTGNARTTPPHLHFGVYRRGEGPVDPYPFLSPAPGQLPELTADVGQLGSWARITTDGIRLREAPGARTHVVRELAQFTLLRVLGSSGEFFRIRLPDGSSGYVAARLTEPTDLPVSAEVASGGRPVRMAPDQTAPVVARLHDGTEVPVLGRYEGYLYVQAPDGNTGWMGVAQQQ